MSLAPPHADPKVNAIRLRNRKYRAKNRHKTKAWQQKWLAVPENRQLFNASKARHKCRNKLEAMLRYCDPVRCAVCGYNDSIDGLVMDHINDDGAKQRKDFGISSRSIMGGTTIYAIIKKKGKIDGLQVLCATCNQIKQLQKWRKESVKHDGLREEINEMCISIRDPSKTKEVLKKKSAFAVRDRSVKDVK